MKWVGDHSRVTVQELAEHDLRLDDSTDVGLEPDDLERTEDFRSEGLQQAKERQDKVHAALEVWIAATIAELAAER